MNTSLSKSQTHIERIRSELKDAGISRFGLYRFTSHYIPNVIHQDEHIKAAVFGRKKESEGFFGIVEGILLATDKRVLYIDHRPGYTTMDEISYEVVSGVNVTQAGPYATLTLFTKITNYRLSYAKPECATQFASYIERRRLDSEQVQTKTTDESESEEMDERTRLFLQNHEIGVLSSIDRTGIVSGAAVYYTVHNDLPYFMTKIGTQKAYNILGNQHVALTVFDEKKLQTVQLQGIVEAESDKKLKRMVSDDIVTSRHYDSGSHLPPLMWLAGDDFIIFRITPTRISFSDYNTR